jgi:hypothetical protein
MNKPYTHPISMLIPRDEIVTLASPPPCI